MFRTRVKMQSYLVSDKEKLKRIIEETGVSRSELARRLEVSYKTIYRWLERDVKPHLAQSRDIDELFKEYVDIREVVLALKRKPEDPIKILKTDKTIRNRFSLEMTYH